MATEEDGVESYKTVQVQRIELVDAEGRLRAFLAVHAEEVVGALLDEEGQRRVVVSVGPEGPRLGLLGADGKLIWCPSPFPGILGP